VYVNKWIAALFSGNPGVIFAHPHPAHFNVVIANRMTTPALLLLRPSLSQRTLCQRRSTLAVWDAYERHTVTD
jgi:hypothetical protein